MIANRHFCSIITWAVFWLKPLTFLSFQPSAKADGNEDSRNFIYNS